MEAIEKVNEMVKAGFPCYYIYTEDESSVERQLEKLAKSYEEVNYQIERWTVNEGEIDNFLNGIIKEPKPTFYFMVNVHFFLEQPGIIQTIKDGTKVWKALGHKVFFLENDKKIPPFLVIEFVDI